MPALLSFLNVSHETKNKFASNIFICAIAVSVIFLFTKMRGKPPLQRNSVSGGSSLTSPPVDATVYLSP